MLEMGMLEMGKGTPMLTCEPNSCDLRGRVSWDRRQVSGCNLRGLPSREGNEEIEGHLPHGRGA